MQNQETGHYEFIVGLPKTEAGERLIYLPADLVALLRTHREKQQAIKAAAFRWAVLDLVFCTRFGTYFTPNQVRSLFDRLLKRARLEHMKFHGLRHNASLILRRMGIDAVVRKEIFGHKSILMTDDVYGHSTSRMHEEAAKDIDRLFNDE
jgi:integrase